MSRAAVAARFVPGRRGPLFAIVRHPGARPRAAVLLVPPVAEEMNKSRRMLSLASQALAARGLATVLVDPFGTGDSGGEFEQADWDTWRDDLARAAAWCAQVHAPVRALLAVRLGCALAADAIARGELPSMERTVFWQPVFDGARWLDQLLRVRVAASMMEEDRKESVGELRSALAAGQSVDVAGYVVSPMFAAQLTRVQAAELFTASLGRLVWFELVRSAGGPLPAASSSLTERARANGVPVDTRVVSGQPFWSSTEIVDVPELIAATTAAFDSLS